MNRNFLRVALMAGAATLVYTSPALAAENTTADTGPIGNGDDIVVVGTKVNKQTPITASVHTFEPQAIV